LSIALWYKGGVKRDEIIRTLKEREADLRAHGVTHAALFGSVARDEQRPDSDIDIMIDIDPSADMSVYDYVGLKRYIASLFDGPVDVIDREGLKPYVRPPAEGDAVYAF
jgi:predicted nucleotidyltransferase